ncbi:hypothetical protein B9Z55_011664 [Caenorhabditis nigoni]|uniref:Uncharacterized protein n=1 Tax=Caenorhabditis nigoni TaxID=1611254 RepID=A0A2G5ULQ4_9PELO|nr:hypothetical protein B9Z55_011664 [Caenorhabditis nigoni]
MLHKTTLLFLALTLIAVAFEEDGGAASVVEARNDDGGAGGAGRAESRELEDHHGSSHNAKSGRDSGTSEGIGSHKDAIMEERRSAVTVNGPEEPKGGPDAKNSSATFGRYGIGASLVLLAAL